MSAIYDQTLRSKESLEPAGLLITNRTERPVDILWISFEAKLIRYKTLLKGGELTMATYKTHPWIFRDYHTGLMMHVNHKEVLWPEPSTEQRPIQNVIIHFPVQSLKTLALWATVIKVRNINEILQMEVPQTLRSDLETLYRQFYNHHVAQLRRQRQNRLIL